MCTTELTAPESRVLHALEIRVFFLFNKTIYGVDIHDSHRWEGDGDKSWNLSHLLPTVGLQAGARAIEAEKALSLTQPGLRWS